MGKSKPQLNKSSRKFRPKLVLQLDNELLTDNQNKNLFLNGHHKAMFSVSVDRAEGARQPDSITPALTGGTDQTSTNYCEKL